MLIKNTILSLAFTFVIVAVAGCGDTINHQLKTDFQRMVVLGDYDSVANVSSRVLKAYYGSVNHGKTKYFLHAGPLSYFDHTSSRMGQEYCNLAIISHNDFVEIFVQVTRKLQVNQLASNLNNNYDTDHSIASPMHTGESLPQNRQIQWRYQGRDRTRENAILTEIKNAVLLSETEK